MCPRWIHPLLLVAVMAVSWERPSKAGPPEGAAVPRSAPVIAGSEIDYPPYCIAGQDGQPDGFSVELLRAALLAVGRDVTFKTGQRTEVKQDLAEGRVQVLPIVGRTPEREAIFDLTFPYITMHGAIVVRDDNSSIRSPSDLKGKRVAVLAGDNSEEYLRRSVPEAFIVPLPSFETALRELSSGKNDAVVIQKLVALHLMQKTGIRNLRTAGPPLKDFTQSLCFAVKKGDNSLLAALNEGLAIVMADGTFRTLYAKWFSGIEAFGRTKSRIVIGGDSAYPPYEFLDANGQPAGFNVDITQTVARRMGLQVEIRLAPWAKTRAGLANGEVDLVQGMFYSVERDRDFEFSPPYTSVEHVFVVRGGSSPPADMKDLEGKSVLVMSGDIMEDLAVKLGYGKQLVAVPSQEEALRLLAAGKHDAALVAMVPALYWIEKHGWKNLRVSEHPVLTAEHCYAVLHGRADLLAPFSEGLAAIRTTGEYRQIQARWLAPYESSKASFKTVARWVLLAVLPLLALLAVTILWSRSLKRQVEVRTRELSAKSAALEAQSEELFRSRETLSSVLDSIPQRVFWKDRHSVYLGCNRPFALDMGHADPAEVVGKTDDDAPWKVHAELYRADDKAIVETGKPMFDIDEPLTNPDGRHILISTSKVPLHDKDGTVIGVLGTYEDVTARKLAEEKVLLLARALRAIGECVSITDPSDTILFVNEAFLRTYGYQEAELIGQPIEMLRSSASPPPAAAEILPATIKGGWQGELINRKKDGTEFPISLSTSVVLDDKGRPMALIGVAWDITEREKAEAAIQRHASDLERSNAELEHAQLEVRRLNAELEDRVLQRTAQLQAANRELEGFSYSVSHDLRAPVRAINGFSKIVLEDYGERLDAEGTRLLEVIRDNADRMGRLIDDLLSFSRVGRQEIRLTQLDMGNMVKNTWRDLVAAGPLPPAELRMEPLPKAHGDPALIGQVLTNLLENALKFSSRRDLRIVEVGSQPGDKETTYYIRDNGAGFDMKYAPKLFGVFQRLHGQTEFPGTGVGLSIVQRIIERHEGRAWAEGTPEAGATFFFTLPVRGNGQVPDS
jgi:PAS domain S-box-containing protein